MKVPYYYLRYSIFNICLLGMMHCGRRNIREWLLKFSEWAVQETNAFARKIISISVVLIIVTFQAKLHWGFWFYGIAGWTYASVKTSQTVVSDPSSVDLNILGNLPAFLIKGIVVENARYLSKPGLLNGKAVFLHFSDGQVLPANYEIVDLVFPHYVFGNLYKNVDRPMVLFRAIQEGLKNRRDGRRFLLPIQVAYPNHSPYMPIDYSGYPSEDTLKEVSFWNVTVFVNDGDAKIVGGTKLFSISKSFE